MADISDVEQALVNTITSVLYPNGISDSSVIGVLCRIYRGWPNSSTLNSDLNAGIVNVTVQPDNEGGRTTTRYLPSWQILPSQPGVTASAEDQTILILGVPTGGDVIGVLIDDQAYSYRIQTGDSCDLVASNLSQLIQVDRPSTANGSTVMIPEASSVEVRVVCDGMASLESRRQEKDMRIICWCSTPTVRDVVASAIDAALDRVNFLLLQDNSNARVTYRNTMSYDQAQNALLYRRDLIYTIEYATISVLAQPSMLFGVADVNGNSTFG